MTSEQKELFEAIQALVTALALCLGGVWTVALFAARRQRFPHAELTQSVRCRQVGAGWALVSIDLVVKNCGAVLLILREAELQLQQVLPARGAFQRSIELAGAARRSGAEVIAWPLLADRSEQWERGALEIEPGECHQLHYDFLVPAEVQTVRVASQVRNTFKGRALWWSTTTLHDTSPEPEQARQGELSPHTKEVAR